MFLTAIAVYVNTLQQDSIISLGLAQVRIILLDIGYHGIWSWSFDTFDIESRWARWTILLLILTFNIMIAFRLNAWIRQFDHKYGENLNPNPDETPRYTTRLSVEEYEF